MTCNSRKKTAEDLTDSLAREMLWSRAVTCLARLPVLAVLLCLTVAASGVTVAWADGAGAGAATGERTRSLDRTSIGFVTGHGEPALDGELSGIAEALRSRHTVTEVHLSEGTSALDGIDVVVVAGGPDIPDAELYALDQFLMRGGRAAFLLDAATIPRTGTQANISEGNIFGFLSAYGIIVNPDLVLDNACAEGALWSGVEATSFYPYWPKVGATGILGTHPVVSGLTSVPMAWTSSISVQRSASGPSGASVLLRSSPDSWTVSAFADLDPDTTFEPPEFLDETHRVAGDEGFPLAVAIERSFRSAFAGQQVIVQRGREVEFVEPAGMVETGAPTRVVVFGSSMMFRDGLSDQLPGSARLMESVVNWLASGYVEPVAVESEVPSREWTPRRLALVMFAVAFAGVVVAAVIRIARACRNARPSGT